MHVCLLSSAKQETTERTERAQGNTVIVNRLAN